MSCTYSLVILFISGFTTALTEISRTDVLEEMSCTIKLPTKHIDKSNEIKWIHLSSGEFMHRKNGKIKINTLGAKIEEDGSLTFESVKKKNTGKYTYTVFNAEGTEIDAGETEIKVYAKAHKPTATFNCINETATITCDIGDRSDLTVSWYKDNTMQKDKKTKLLLTSAQVQENKPYSCRVSNPVSSEKSDSVTVSCAISESPAPCTLFGLDLWIMVIILAGSGALLLLLLLMMICVLLFSIQCKKHQKDERDFRLRNLQAPDSTKTDPNTAETSDYQ